MRSRSLALFVFLALGADCCIQTQVTQGARQDAGTPLSALEYQGWTRDFRIIDTELGHETALLDLRTRLQWLNLRLVQRQGTEQLSKRMRSGGELAAWRYATADDLRAMLVDFTGNPDGLKNDVAKERALQRLLGGPLQALHNKGGWSRRDSRGFLNQLECIPQNMPQGEPPLPPVICGGYTTHFVYIDEDTQNGQTGGGIDLQQGWIASSRDLGTFEGDAILLVRDDK